VDDMIFPGALSAEEKIVLLSRELAALREVFS
jgi:hypothetical protein